jgi:hypothetical protein
MPRGRASTHVRIRSGGVTSSESVPHAGVVWCGAWCTPHGAPSVSLCCTAYTAPTLCTMPTVSLVAWHHLEMFLSVWIAPISSPAGASSCPLHLCAALCARACIHMNVSGVCTTEKEALSGIEHHRLQCTAAASAASVCRQRLFAERGMGMDSPYHTHARDLDVGMVFRSTGGCTLSQRSQSPNQVHRPPTQHWALRPMRNGP